MRNPLLISVSVFALGLGLTQSGSATVEVSTEFAGLNTLVQFNFAERPLEDTLLEFSDLTGLGLVFDSRLMADRIAPALTGEFSAQVALDLLLEGSGLHVVDVGGDTLAIVPVRHSAASLAYETGNAPEIISTGFEANASAVVDELLILGTRTANPPYYKFKPTVALSGEKLRFSGTVNVSDYLFQLPSMLSDITAANTTIFGTPAGLNLADLRGIGPERTLVLINGRRVIPTYGGSLTLYGVDLNSIPSSLVQRIDVINGGAATSYGVDAVAGVVNFTLRDDIEGWSGAVQGGITEHGDRDELLASLTYGTKFADDRGYFAASLTVDDQSGLDLKDRAVTANPSGFAVDGRRASTGQGELTPGFGGSSYIPQGIWQGVVTEADDLFWFGQSFTFSDDGQSIEPNTQQIHQIYNYAEDQTLLTPLDRMFLTMNASYEVASGHKLLFEGSFVDTNVTSQLAAIPLTVETGLANFGGELITIPVTNPYIPDAVRDEIASRGIGDAEGIILSRRLLELGPRRTYISRQTIRGLIGMQGMIAPGWSYDMYYQYGRNDVDEERDGLLDVLNFRAAVDPDLCAHTTGCSVINPFGIDQITQRQVGFLTAANAFRHIKADQHVVSAVVSGPADMFVDLDGKMTLGVEYRHESLDDAPDKALDERPVSGSLIFPGSSGSFDVFEAFADITLPLVAERPFFEELTATFGARVSDFSTTGTLLNWHAGGLWQPVEGLSFRASYQSGRRAPNIAELYAGGPGGFSSYEDPCSGLSADDNSVIAQNCRSDGPLGVPDGFVQSKLLVDAKNFGNPNLDAERSSNFTWGGSFESENIFGDVPGRIRLSFDAYQIEVKDYIVSLDAFQTLDICYKSTNFENAFCGTNPISDEPYIARDNITGNLSVVTSTIINAGYHRLKGYDIELQYIADLSAAGLDAMFDQISLTGLYTRNLEVVFQAQAGDPEEDYLGTAKYPKHRFQGGISLTRGNMTFDWDVRYRGKAVSYNTLSYLPEAQIKAVWYNDLGVRYGLNEDVTLYGGVRNIFDQKAPSTYIGSIGDTFPEFYDTLGRRFYLGAVFDF